MLWGLLFEGILCLLIAGQTLPGGQGYPQIPSGLDRLLTPTPCRDFLPRGSGIVTRRPLVLQLVNSSTGGCPLSAARRPLPEVKPSLATEAVCGVTLGKVIFPSVGPRQWV